jgi:zinc transporter ZupT
MALVLALGTFFSTAAGGLFALRFRDRLHLILGFSAGVILGVIAFDLLPEIADLVNQTGESFRTPMIALVVGFLGFHVIEKSLLIHNAHEGEYRPHAHGSPAVGVASALALAAHSLTDGIAIGLSVQIDRSVGVAVAVAVIAHDFADGLNTVSLMLANNNTRRRALAMLALDALTPLIGAALTLFISVPERGLLISLGVFAGFLLYIGASDVLPEAHADHPSGATIAMTLLGTGVMYVVIGLLRPGCPSRSRAGVIGSPGRCRRPPPQPLRHGRGRTARRGKRSR